MTKKKPTNQPPVTHDQLKAVVAAAEARLLAKIEDSGEETRRHLAVAVETISSEVRGAFHDATAVLTDKVQDHESRLTALEHQPRR